MNVTVAQIKEALEVLVTARSTLAPDVREVEYQGKVFAYPCVRYGVDTCEPNECDDYRVNFTLWAWSEAESSLEVTRIIDELAEALDGTRTTAPIVLQVIKLQSVPRTVRDSGLWRGEAYFQCLASI